MEELLHFREFPVPYGDHSGILETDSVYHTVWSLSYPGSGISESRLQRGSLEAEGPEYIYVIKVLEFLSEAESSGSRDNGIIELYPEKIH